MNVSNHTTGANGRTTVAIDTPTFRGLSELGRENERSASAEARVALKRHLEEAERKKKKTAAGPVSQVAHLNTPEGFVEFSRGLAESKDLSEQERVHMTRAALYDAHDFILKLGAERDRYRAALSRCAEISGADTSDGPPIWPDVDVWAVREVEQLRKDYDEALEREDA